MDEQQWIDLAKRRVLNILRKRRFASNRQLEKTISEAGPPDIRPEPMKVSAAIKELVHDGRVLPISVPGLSTFYTPTDFGGDADEQRQEDIIALSRDFRALTQNPQACGKALEQVVYDAALQSRQYTVLGNPNRPPARGFAINGYVLERECDHILIPKESGPKLVVEDKNLREWLHPSAEEVWSVIGKALRVPRAIPILICRRMHYVGFSLFSRIGLACWQVYRQFFSPAHITEEQLEPYRHTDRLGFADITSNLSPPPALVNFFRQTLPIYMDDFQERFEENRELLTEYAITGRLDSNIPTSTRNRLFAEFQRVFLLLRNFRVPPSGPKVGTSYFGSTGGAVAENPQRNSIYSMYFQCVTRLTSVPKRSSTLMR